MKRTIVPLVAAIASIIPTPGPAIAASSAPTPPDPSWPPAADYSVPDPWAMFVDQYARDLGVTYERAEDKIGAWLRCLDGSCRPEVEQWRRLALKVGWPESEWSRLACVIHGESRGQEHVVYRGTRRKPEHSIGLLQLNTRGGLWRWFADRGVADRVELLDPETNLRLGLAMWSDRGWRPWTAARTCR